jgi:hypothetical protein
MWYRCYLIRNGRIDLGDDINAERLADAIAHGHKILAMQPQPANFSGIEIWHGELRVYGDDCYADGTGHLTPVVSPFQTSESTMFLARGLYFVLLDQAPRTSGKCLRQLSPSA